MNRLACPGHTVCFARDTVFQFYTYEKPFVLQSSELGSLTAVAKDIRERCRGEEAEALVIVVAGSEEVVLEVEGEIVEEAVGALGEEGEEEEEEDGR